MALRWFLLTLLIEIGLTACTSSAPTNTPLPPTETGEAACPVTQPEWLLPPEDSAVNNPPVYGYYYTNADQSILASAWWAEGSEYRLRADPQGVKVGWFRPAGATMEVTGRRLDGEAPPLEAHLPCCYPTRFQSSGLYFPTEGCWEVAAKAGGSELTFTVWVDP